MDIVQNTLCSSTSQVDFLGGGETFKKLDVAKGPAQISPLKKLSYISPRFMRSSATITFYYSSASKCFQLLFTMLYTLSIYLKSSTPLSVRERY